jgi:Inovirus Coat protein B
MKTKFKKIAGRALAVAAGVALSAGSAMAAGIDITADVATGKTDVITNGTAVMGVVVAVAVFGWLRKVVK